MALDSLVGALRGLTIGFPSQPEKAQPVPLPVNPCDTEIDSTAEGSDRSINPFLSKDTAIKTQLKTQMLARFESLDGNRTIFKDTLKAHGIDSEKLRASSNQIDISDTLDNFFRWFADLAHLDVDDSAPIEKVTTILNAALWNDFFSNNKKPFLFKTETFFHKTQEITLTKAQFAVVLDDIALLLAMLEAGYSVTETCIQGYTLAHFAAIFRRYEMLMLIHSHDPAIFEQRTATGATVYDLLAAQGFSAIDQSSHMCVHTSAALFQLWLLKATFTLPNDLSSPGKNALRQYLQVKQSKTMYQPPVYAAKVTNSQWGLKAKQNFEAGQFILASTGVVKSSCASIDNPNSPEIHDVIHNLKLDSSNQGALSSKMRHGPPNCVELHILVHGQIVVLICATRAIKQGEELFCNRSNTASGLSDTSLDASRLIEVSHYLKDTRQLMRLPQHVCEHQSCLRVSLGHVEMHTITTTKVYIKDYDRDALLHLHCNVDYHQNMVNYFYNNPERLVELVKSGKVTREAALDYFAACRLMVEARGYSACEVYRRLQKRLFGSFSKVVNHWVEILDEFKVDTEARKQLALSCLKWFLQHTSLDEEALRALLWKNHENNNTEPFIFIIEEEQDRPVFVITQLQCALMLGDTELVKKMLIKNPDLATEKSTHSYTNAHFAAIFRRKEALAYLLASGAALADFHPDGIPVLGYYLENELEKNAHFEIFQKRFQSK